MMRRAERTLNELYSFTEKIMEPEITPVLEGNCRIQGPVDESDHELCRTNSADKKFAFINKSFHMRVESGTCNVCSAPCSSCMHNNRNFLAMESNIECGSSRNSCAIKEVDSCSFVCADGMDFYKSRTCDEHATSEASNFVSASSSHDSDSENAESKATARASATCEGPEDVDMPTFKSSRAAVEDQIVQEKKSDMDDTSDLCHSTCPNNDKQRGLECLGDNLSCITGNDDSNNDVAHVKMHLDMKNATYTTLTGILLPRSAETTMHVELTDSFHGHKNAGRQSSHERDIPLHEELFHKKCTDSTYGFSFKSDFAEAYQPSHNSSPNIQSLHSPSCNGYVVCHSGDCKDSDGSSDCQHCIGGESSLGTALAMAIDGKKKFFDRCMENENALAEVIKSRNVNEKLKKPSYLVEASAIQEPLPQLRQVMNGGSSESETELKDIKVCDICGDAGREELLAVCSRCSDGAEHTYCMRKMIRKIPEGDWLCEECQLKDDAGKMVDMPEKLSTAVTECKVTKDTEVTKVDMLEKLSETEKDCKLKEHAEDKKGIVSEFESIISKICKHDDVENNKKVHKSEPVSGTPKQTCLNETNSKFENVPNLKVLPKLDMKAGDQDMRMVARGLQSPKIIAKRHAESLEVLSSSSKKTQEITGQCIEIGSPRKKPALSRESSFKKLDTGKAMVPNMPTSKGGHSPNSHHCISRSQSLFGSHLPKVQDQLQPPHGLLVCSVSFNNVSLKPKLKQLTESVPIQPKIARESSFSDTRKEALARSITKSASFKCTTASCSNIESACKTQFIHQLHVEDPRCLKRVKESNNMEKKSYILNRPPTNSSLRAGTVTPLSKMGRNETKKHPISSAKALGSASLNATGNSDQRLCQTPREGACGSSSSIDKIYSIAEAGQHRSVVQSTGSIHRDDKTKDLNIFSNSRQAGLGRNQKLHCQRCNELGHATEFCSIDKVRSSALKPLAEKNSKDGNKKVNKWKYAVQTTISNRRLQKKNGHTDHDQSKVFPISSVDPSMEVGSKDFLPGSSNHLRECPLVIQTSDGQEEIFKRSDDCTTIDHGMSVGQQTFPLANASYTPSALQSMEAFCTPEPGNLNVTASDDLNANHFLHILPGQASALASPRRSSAIPELEFIWQGSLEVLTTGNEHASFDGIQAHLSAAASPKVLEVATKFPFRVQLEEVSWISSWPLQFQGISPDEHNIAIFFFATDTESYERSYSKLLEKMLKHDLVLRGFIDGIELLIFPSTKLPVHSQRWNRLFFLWGILKRSADSLTSKLSSGKRSAGSILDREPTIHDLPCALRSVMSDSWTALSVEIPEKKSDWCKMPSEAMALKSIARASPKVEDGMCRAQDSDVNSSSFQLAAHDSLPSEQSSYLFPISHSPSNENLRSNLLIAHLGSRPLVADTCPCSEVKNDDSYRKHFDFRGRHVDPSAQMHTTDELGVLACASTSYCASNDCRKGTGREGIGEGAGEEKMRSEDLFYGESERNLIAIDQLSCERSNRKRARSCSMEAISQSSMGTVHGISKAVLWKDEVDYYAAADNGRERKRTCSREAEASSCTREETSSARFSSKVHPTVAGFLGEQQEYIDGESVEAVISDSSTRQAERVFFPGQPSLVQNRQSENIVHILSSDDEDAPESDSPDLELALGGKWRAQKKREEEEPAGDVSASLSLSLAVSTLKKERPDLNASLLLFDGFTDT